MQITEVRTPDHQKEFLMLPVRLYAGDKNWIRPLDKDIEAIFSPQKNKYFTHGECTRWLLLDNSGQTIGRVAAFINRNTAFTFDQPTGGMGFFECINDQQAAFTLFETCREWLQARGMEAMDGPINFGDRNQWWGLLVDGFTEPNYGMFYHHRYYRNLFEAYGFRDYFQQYTYSRKVMEPLHPIVVKKAERIFQNPEFSFRHIEKSRLDKYGEDFRTIYNKAWAYHEGVPEMTPAQVKAIMAEFKPVLDEDIVWFAYHNQEPVGFFVMLPEMNQIFKYVNGKLDAVGIVKFLWHRWRRTCKKMFGLVFGFVPEYRGKGLESAIVVAAGKHVQVPGQIYEDFEMNWIGDFNPTMMKMVEIMGGKVCKTHITFRKLFDETREFKRAPVLGPGKLN
jgi:GNAT superfamily N-acetyltransferase